ncbi:DUF3239 domain-containing protein [Corynebacterium choanae]|uniref:DUF3239 domain-containing protein n=1 Tax=Corynebacterium choanae TaxID=1862358 RepID=A0A3G6J4X6_9CORY|nr:DUF3239 domain-containing protein [Corynebacterium choanae]AZA13016.1 hypothetical protein CCHOA_03015 [Corynebacterium choanae]
MNQPARPTITVNDAHNRKYDEYYRDPKQLQYAAVGLGALFVAVGAYFWWSTGKTAGGTMALIAFAAVGLVFMAIAVVIPKKVGSPQHIYDTYPLCPAVIVECHADDTVTIAGLVDAATDVAHGTPRIALATRTVRHLPGHQLQVGERVPVVAVPGRRAVLKNRDHWAEMTLMPIAWATPEHGVIRRCAGAISEAKWRKLKSSIRHYEDMKQHKETLRVL